MSVLQPPHPVSALTTFELSRYRSELECALQTPPRSNPASGLLQVRLAEVLAEQDDRRRITGARQEPA
jgi:hypothetical protein